MARRRIGQEQLWSERAARSIGASLDEVASLADWVELGAVLARISSSSEGESETLIIDRFRLIQAQ